jgi:hypothetical protein
LKKELTKEIYTGLSIFDERLKIGCFGDFVIHTKIGYLQKCRTSWKKMARLRLGWDGPEAAF